MGTMWKIRTKRIAWIGLLLASVIATMGLLVRQASAANASVNTVVLYDGSLGGLPGTQQLSYLGIGSSLLSPPQATQGYANGATTLDSTPAMVDKAGYFDLGANVPPLSRTVGFRLTFDIQLLEENHASNDRSGLSVIVLADDMHGVELGFWSNEVWAQNDAPLFTHGEGNPTVDPTSGLTRYTLDVLQDSYTLTTNSVVLLTGSVRDYQAATGAFSFVYNTANLVFIGDNSSSADATSKLAYVAISQGIPVEVPTAINLHNMNTINFASCGLIASWIFLLGATSVLRRRCVRL